MEVLPLKVDHDLQMIDVHQTYDYHFSILFTSFYTYALG